MSSSHIVRTTPARTTPANRLVSRFGDGFSTSGDIAVAFISARSPRRPGAIVARGARIAPAVVSNPGRSWLQAPARRPACLPGPTIMAAVPRGTRDLAPVARFVRSPASARCSRGRTGKRRAGSGRAANHLPQDSRRFAAGSQCMAGWASHHSASRRSAAQGAQETTR